MTDLPRLSVIGVDPVRNKLYATLTNEQGTPIGFEVLDGNTHEVVARVGVISGEPVGVNPTTGRAYVPHRDTKNISIIDANTNTEISRVSLSRRFHAP